MYSIKFNNEKVYEFFFFYGKVPSLQIPMRKMKSDQ